MPHKDSPITIQSTHSAPHHIPVITKWLQTEWGHHNPGWSFDDHLAHYKTYAVQSGLPIQMVAVQNDQPIGCVTLNEDDLPSEPDLGPWVSGLFVPEEFRRQGLGQILLAGAEAEAKRQGYTHLYLFNRSAIKFYTKASWVPVKTVLFREKEYTVFQKKL